MALNKSIFDLPSSLEDIRRSEEVIKVATRRVQPKAASKGANFPGSPIQFDFTLSANQHWIPSRSYVVIRDKFFTNNAAPLDANNKAPAFNCQDNLFDGVELTMGGHSMSTRTKLYPQIAACERRVTKSKSWFEGFGASCMHTIPDFAERKALVRSDNGGEGLYINERLFQPTLGIFKMSKALPPARYELILRPKPDIQYKKSFTQGAADVAYGAGVRDPAGAGNAEYYITDIVFYIAIVDNYERVPDKMTYVFDLEETKCISRSIAAAAGSVTENFTVSKSTFALSLALQDSRSGSNSIVPPGDFRISDGNTERLVTSLRVEYAGQQRPVPAANFSFSDGGADGIDHQTHRYAENAVESLAAYDTGGALSKQDWRKVGPLYHFQFRRPGDDISTNVDVEITHGDFGQAAYILLFYHYRRVVSVTVENGQVISILGQDA